MEMNRANVLCSYSDCSNKAPRVCKCTTPAVELCDIHLVDHMNRSSDCPHVIVESTSELVTKDDNCLIVINKQRKHLVQLLQNMDTDVKTYVHRCDQFVEHTVAIMEHQKQLAKDSFKNFESEIQQIMAELPERCSNEELTDPRDLFTATFNQPYVDDVASVFRN